MFRTSVAAALASGSLFIAGVSWAQPAPPPADLPSNDYSDKANWLCWPGRDDACASDLTTTVVKADGSTSVQTFKADPRAPIDCFYVYPTVSADPGMISTMKVEPAETNVVVQQAARLGAKCRLYAPMYRQFTLTALVYFMMHPLPPAEMAAAAARPQVGYNDVKDAWNYYLAHENHGRGVVLVGHSQGSGVLTQLIKQEIDGKPAQKQLVSALLMGTVLTVPDGKDVGGDFHFVPLCHSDRQLGCAIAYASFRESSLPPPDTTFFGRSRKDQPGLEAACVNPANLAGGSGPTESYFGTMIAMAGPAKFAWLKDKTIDTPFVSVPGLLTATCVHSGDFHILAIHINADPASPRASDIPGDIAFGKAVLKDWGLHLVDANLFMGNLEDIVGAEGQAWVAQKR